MIGLIRKFVEMTFQGGGVTDDWEQMEWIIIKKEVRGGM